LVDDELIINIFSRNGEINTEKDAIHLISTT